MRAAAALTEARLQDGAGARRRRADREPDVGRAGHPATATSSSSPACRTSPTLMLEALSGQLEGGRPLLSRDDRLLGAGKRGRRPARRDRARACRLPDRLLSLLPGGAGRRQFRHPQHRRAARWRPAAPISPRGSRRPGGRSSPRSSDAGTKAGSGRFTPIVDAGHVHGPLLHLVCRPHRFLRRASRSPSSSPSR